MSPDTSPSPSVANPPARHGPSAVRLFPIVIAVMVVAMAAVSLSCTWQERMEQDLAFGVNQIRAEHGLPPLTVDPQLTAIAQYRAQDMATNNYFGHAPPDGCAARCLMERAGLAPAWVGEVIAWNNTSVDQSAGMTIGMWRDSPQHLGTITNGCFTRMGAGAVIAGDGNIYHVAVFEGRAPGC